MDRAAFERIRDKHGDYASWAVWAEAGARPKSNIGDLSVLDPDRNPALLETLRPHVVMLGLVVSRPVTFTAPFYNFHDTSSVGQDFKIRYAFAQTPYWGAYMTDFVKGTIELTSGELRRRVKTDPELVRSSVELLLEEFADLGCDAPLLIAFGDDAHELAAIHLQGHHGRLIKVAHYASRHYNDKVLYREHVRSALGLPTEDPSER